MRRTCRGITLLCVSLVIFGAPLTRAAAADDQVGTLQLDATSYVSYSDSQNPPIPAGSTIRFHFGSPGADGVVPISVSPGDLSIAPVPVADGLAIQYTLAGPASGTLRKVGGAKEIELFATLVATLQGASGTPPPVAYELRFTTGTAQATSADATTSVTVDGVPAAGANYVQLVGAATNRPDAFPAPGEAVYAILSGTFDSLPVLP